MQTLEACFSLAFFSSIAAAALLAAAPGRVDDSLYRMELAQDAWRVMYLRGDFEGLNLSDHEDQWRIRDDLEALGQETSLCFFVSGAPLSNCPGGEEKEDITSLRKTVIDEGAPRTITFSVKN